MNKKNTILLLLSTISLLVSCTSKSKVDENAYFDVTFNTNTTVSTNNVPSQRVRYGMHAKKPEVYTTDSNYKNYVIYNWYSDKDLKNVWKFTKNKVTSSLTLYAQWGYEYQVNYYLSGNENPVYTTTLKEGEKAEERYSDAIGYMSIMEVILIKNALKLLIFLCLLKKILIFILKKVIPSC